MCEKGLKKEPFDDRRYNNSLITDFQFQFVKYFPKFILGWHVPIMCQTFICKEMTCGGYFNW